MFHEVPTVAPGMEHGPPYALSWLNECEGREMCVCAKSEGVRERAHRNAQFRVGWGAAGRSGVKGGPEWQSRDIVPSAS